MNRRQFVLGTGIALTGAVGIGANVLADEHELPVVIAAANPMGETVVLENISDGEVDLGGYQLDWEYADDETQTDAFELGVTIEAGAQLVVWSGFQSEQIGAVDDDHQIADYDDGRIKDTNSDVIALLSPSAKSSRRAMAKYSRPSSNRPKTAVVTEETTETVVTTRVMARQTKKTITKRKKLVGQNQKKRRRTRNRTKTTANAAYHEYYF